MNSVSQITVRVEKNGDLFIDGIKKEIVDLTRECLESIVDKSLEGQVAYQIEGEMPIAKFFTSLEEGTAEGSELRKMKDKMDGSKNPDHSEMDSSNALEDMVNLEAGSVSSWPDTF